jgi:hypothetical protein
METPQRVSHTRSRELWLQHGAGFIVFRDMREYAIMRLDPLLDDATRAAAIQAINDAVYGLMMVIDGVSGRLGDGTRALELDVRVRLREGEALVAELPLREGDGMCMGYHSWLKGDFGEDPVAK